MEHPETFGHWVKQRRQVLCLTQTDLGRLVSCSKVMINKIEGDQRRPSLPLLRLLTLSLKVPPGERAAFISLARPELTRDQIDEITASYSRSMGLPVKGQPAYLPAPLTPIIGRAQEVSAVCTLLLDPGVRLVTLTGTGGVGKTRLGIQVASEICAHFQDGCRFITLSTLASPDLLVSAIAHALGLKESHGQTLEDALLHFLGQKEILMVLDNFEQLLPSAKTVAEMLSCSPGLKVLVTSRTLLHLSGEYEFVVPPLRFVTSLSSLSNEDLVNSPAVALFVQKAKAVKTDFSLTAENSSLVAKICAHLDGLPLAIELAASHSKFLSPEAILSRLEGSTPEDGPLDVLSGGPQDFPARQQTMRRTIDWSYDLLNKNEQDLFRRLSVFVGGCTLEEAAAVCGEWNSDRSPHPGSSPNSTVIAGRLTSLVDQSMLQQVHRNGLELRFEMLETLREYACERLSNRNNEWERLKHRHAAFFMELVEINEHKFESAEQAAWLDRLEREHDNIQAALNWSCETDEGGEIGLRLVAALWQFWLVRGYVNEGRMWSLRILNLQPSLTILSRARALNGAGFLHWAWNDFEAANALLQESLRIFQELGDRHGTAWVLNHLGHVALAQNHIMDALTFVDESLAIFRELDSPWNIAWDLLNLGEIYRLQGNEAQAVLYYRESLDLFRRVDDPRGTAWNLDHLGRLANAHQDYEKATSLLTESLGLFRRMGDKRSAAWVLQHLGEAAQSQNKPERVQLYLGESQALFREIGVISSPPDESS